MVSIVLIAVKAAALLLVAFGVNFVFRRKSSSLRYFVWYAASAAVLVIPAGEVLTPVRLTVIPIPFSSMDMAGSDRHAGIPAGGSSLAESSNTRQSAATPVRDTRATTLSGWLRDKAREPSSLVVLVWLLISIVLLTSLGRAWLAMRALVAGALDVDSDEWREVLEGVASRFKLSRLPRIVVSDAVSVPFACSYLRAVIVLPADCNTWTRSRREAVLAHEIAHIERRDIVGHTLGRIVCAVYWFNPLAWSAASRMRMESEQACDDRVISYGLDPADYAEHLVDVAAMAGRTPKMAIAMAAECDLERRVLAVLNSDMRRRTVNRKERSFIALTLAAITLVTTAAAPAVRGTNAAQDGTRMMGLYGTLRAYNYAQLVDALQSSSDPAVRRLAAWRIAQSNRSDRRVVLAKSLLGDSDVGVREMSAWAIGWSDIVKSDVLPSLEGALEVEPNDGVREMIAWSLARAGDKVKGAALLDGVVANDQSPVVRATAAWAIGFLRVRRAPEGLIKALSDENDDVRLKASWALARIGDASAIPSVRSALASERNDGVMRMMLAAAGEARPGTSQSVDEVVARVMSGRPPEGADSWPQPRPRANPIAMSKGVKASLVW